MKTCFFFIEILQRYPPRDDRKLDLHHYRQHMKKIVTRAQMSELVGPRLKALISEGSGTIVAFSSAMDIRCKNPAINAKHTLSHHVASHLNIQITKTKNRIQGKANTAILLEIVRASNEFQDLGWPSFSLSHIFNRRYDFYDCDPGEVESMFERKVKLFTTTACFAIT